MSDQDLAKQLQAYKEVAATNKNVDITALMLNALEKEQANKLPAKQKRIAYFVSLAFPPFGLIYAIKFYFSGAEDGKKAALYCALLTIFVIVITTIFLNVIVSSSGTSVEQLQQAPAQLRSLYE